MTGSVVPVRTSIDSAGRIVVPKPLRDALGLAPGSELDISRYGAGLQLVPAGRTARLVDEGDSSSPPATRRSTTTTSSG